MKKLYGKGKQMLSVLLAVAMMLTCVPQTGMTVLAAPEDAAAFSQEEQPQDGEMPAGEEEQEEEQKEEENPIEDENPKEEENPKDENGKPSEGDPQKGQDPKMPENLGGGVSLRQIPQIPKNL